MTQHTFAYKEFINKKIGWKNVKVIKVVLDWSHKVVTSVSFSGDNFEDLVKKEWWNTWVNGAYFMPTDYGFAQNDTNADRIYKQEKFFKFSWDFWVRWMMWFDVVGSPIFVLNNEGYDWNEAIQYNTWEIDDIYYWISNHPVLLLEWENVLDKSEKVIDSKMKASSTKSFICFTQDKNTIFMWNISSLKIYEVPSFIKNNFGCYNAINLDSGWSLGFMYDGKVYNKPWRKIMDAFVVVDLTPEQAEADRKIKEEKEKKEIQAFIKEIKDDLNAIKEASPEKEYFAELIKEIKFVLKDSGLKTLEKLKKTKALTEDFLNDYIYWE